MERHSEAIAIHQDPGCLMADIVRSNTDWRVYVKPLGGAHARDGWAAGLANRFMTNNQAVTIHWSDLGLAPAVPCEVRSVWDHQDLGVRTHSFTAEVPAKGFGLYKITLAGERAAGPPIHTLDGAGDADLRGRREQLFEEDHALYLRGPRVTPAGMFECRVPGPAGQVVTFETSENLVSWVPFAAVTNVTGAGACLSHPAGRESARYFRARVER
jgi:hypothetical protein